MSTPKKFYISDLHLGHKNILAFDNRPFFNLKEMTETIISNWNSVVGKNDSVYVLGDMFWNNSEIPKIMPRLNGNKYLIKGNHDRVDEEMKKHFVWIKNYAVIKDGSEHVVIKGECYYFDKSEPIVDVNKKAFVGFSGRRFKIKMLDTGEIIETNNLWNNGTVAEKFREQLPDNAEFVK